MMAVVSDISPYEADVIRRQSPENYVHSFDYFVFGFAYKDATNSSLVAYLSTEARRWCEEELGYLPNVEESEGCVCARAEFLTVDDAFVFKLKFQHLLIKITGYR